jgi:hypothetical protein
MARWGPSPGLYRGPFDGPTVTLHFRGATNDYAQHGCYDASKSRQRRYMQANKGPYGPYQTYGITHLTGQTDTTLKTGKAAGPFSCKSAPRCSEAVPPDVTGLIWPTAVSLTRTAPAALLADRTAPVRCSTRPTAGPELRPSAALLRQLRWGVCISFVSVTKL